MNEKLNQEERDDIARIIKVLDEKIGEPPAPRPKGPDGNYLGITVREYCAQKNCTETIGRKILENAIEKGIMRKEAMVFGIGSTPFVYFLKNAE